MAHAEVSSQNTFQPEKKVAMHYECKKRMQCSSDKLGILLIPFNKSVIGASNGPCFQCLDQAPLCTCRLAVFKCPAS